MPGESSFPEYDRPGRRVNTAPILGNRRTADPVPPDAAQSTRPRTKRRAEASGSVALPHLDTAQPP